MPTSYRYPVTITSFEPSPQANTMLVCNNLGNPEWIDRSIANLQPTKLLQNLSIDANAYGSLIITSTFPYYEIIDNGNYSMNIDALGGVAYTEDAYGTPYFQFTLTKLTLQSSFLNQVYTQFMLFYVWKRTNLTGDQMFLWCEKSGTTNFTTTPCLSLVSVGDVGGYYSLNVDGDVINTAAGTYSKKTEWSVTTLSMAIIDGLQYISIRENGASLYSSSNYVTKTLPFSYFISTLSSKLIGFDSYTSNTKINTIYCIGKYDVSNAIKIEKKLMYNVSKNNLVI